MQKPSEESSERDPEHMHPQVLHVKIQIFSLSTSEERKKTLAKSLKVGVEVPQICKNGSESLSSKLS